MHSIALQRQKKVPQKKTDGHRKIVRNAVVSAVRGEVRDLSEGVRGCVVFADAKLPIRMLLVFISSHFHHLWHVLNSLQRPAVAVHCADYN